MVGCRNRTIVYRCTAWGGLGPDDSAYEGDTDAALVLEPAAQILLTTSSDAISLKTMIRDALDDEAGRSEKGPVK